MKQKLLLFGGTGQIGSRIVDLLSRKYIITAPTHQEIDLSISDSIRNIIQETRPDIILHAAGFTSIDKAPENPIEAFNANAACFFTITQEAKKIKAPVYYLSTDIVFNGLKTNTPYAEKDTPDPLSLNAKYKRIGELITLDADKRNGVIRLIVCFSAYFPKRPDLARLAVSRVKDKQVFTATDDQMINPIYVDDLVAAIDVIIKNRATGIYHVGGTTYTTPYKFAKKIVSSLGLDEELVQPSTFESFAQTRPEPRPINEWLDVSKFEKEFGKGILKSVDSSIKRFARDYKKH